MKSFQLWWDDPLTISRLETALKKGEVIAGTSDTVLGFLADTTNQGFLALNAIKGRQDKPYLILIASSDKLTSFIQGPLSPEVKKLISACWPGPLTLVLPATLLRLSGQSARQAPAGKTVALRVPNHPGLLKLLPHFEGLYSTSANLSGNPVPATLDGLDASIREKVAYLVGDTKAPEALLPSTIIDCTGDKLKVLREGAYAIAELEKIIGYKI